MKLKTVTLLSTTLATTMIAGYLWISRKLFIGSLTRNHSIDVGDTTNYSSLDEVNSKAEEWLCKMNPQEVYITSHDGLQLYGRIVQNFDNHKWIILIHGYKASSKSMLDAAKRLNQAGYNILLVDNRSHGKSEGTYIGMGWLDRLDICRWIDYVIQQDADAKIALHGVSMGGATVMMAAGEALPNNVICAIEDCGYTSVSDIFLERAAKMYNFPPELLYKGFEWFCKKEAKYSTYEASSLEQLKKATIPMLFIHGDSDDFVPFESVYQNYEACQSRKDLLIVEGKGHALSCLDEQYYPTVLNFLTTYM